MKRKCILFGLMAVCAICLSPVAGYSQSPQIGITTGRAQGLVAVVLGLIGMVLSVVHLGRSTGGFGTGSGRAGAIVALVLGLIGMNVGGLVLARSRRSR